VSIVLLRVLVGSTYPLANIRFVTIKHQQHAAYSHFLKDEKNLTKCILGEINSVLGEVYLLKD
jgi:hypothetical protein